MYTYTEPGNYACATNAVAATLKNCPLSTAFDLKVYHSAGGKTDGYIIQEYTAHDAKQRVLVPYDPYTSGTKWGNPIFLATKSDFICGESIISANTGSTNVTFPQAFNNIPVVVAVAKGASKYVMLVVKVEGISKSGFMVTAVTFENGSTTPPPYDITIEWIAMRKS